MTGAKLVKSLATGSGSDTVSIGNVFNTGTYAGGTGTDTFFMTPTSSGTISATITGFENIGFKNSAVANIAYNATNTQGLNTLIIFNDNGTN
ncbi:MAG: hypothetical protein QM527_12455 [Alphaproteobacteria bacterium]|nr:hypothetical protein [Alphaproteobacteria bacterium]